METKEIKAVCDMLSSFVCYCNDELNEKQIVQNLRNLGLPREILEHAEIMVRRITPSPTPNYLVWRYAEKNAQMHFGIQNWINVLKSNLGNGVIPNVTVGKHKQVCLEQIVRDMDLLLSKAIDNNTNIKDVTSLG